MNSLVNQDTDRHFTVFILINYKDDDNTVIKAESTLLYEKLTEKSISYSSQFELKIFIKELIGKHKGVGLARKYLMDTAFLKHHISGEYGIISNLDADTLVDNNYISSILSVFKEDKILEAISISFCHRLEEYALETNSAIINYELHLRYFINMQRICSLPYAYQTVGSAMAVRADAYAKDCLLYTSPSPRDKRQSRMPSSA